MKLALLFGRVFGLGLMVAAKDDEGDDFIVWFSPILCFRGKSYFVALTSEGFGAGSHPWNGML